MSQLLTEALDRLGTDLFLVVTGAGVSRASGIATFRGSDPDAIWSHSDVELATRGYFERDPVGQWLWYSKRFETVDSAKPNAAHRALTTLERWQTARGGKFLLVTQNIDTLHEQAGSRQLIKVHGTSDRLRCSHSGCVHASPSGSLSRPAADIERFRRDPSEKTLPRCPACDGVLRAHVLFFDEYYDDHVDYEFDRTTEAAEEAGLILFAGTSFSVGITDMFLRTAEQRRIPAFSIDPAAVKPHGLGNLTLIEEPAEDVLPSVCKALGARIPDRRPDG